MPKYIPMPPVPAAAGRNISSAVAARHRAIAKFIERRKDKK